MEQEHTTYVKFTGLLDVYRRGEVEDLLPEAGAEDRVVFDCSAVDSIDSTILGLFMRFRRRFAEGGGDPLNIVIIASASVRRTLEITGLAKQVTVLNAAPGLDPGLDILANNK